MGTWSDPFHTMVLMVLSVASGAAVDPLILRTNHTRLVYSDIDKQHAKAIADTVDVIRAVAEGRYGLNCNGPANCAAAGCTIT